MKKNVSYLATGCRLAVLFSAVVLSACGGGGGDATAPATDGSLSFGGSAATGAAIPNATVEAKCLGGTTASTITSNLGSYRLTLPQGSRQPCIVRVATAGGYLHAAVDETYLFGEVNITPLTDQVLARSGRGTAGALYAALSNSPITALSATSLNGAQADVLNTFRGLVSLPTIRSLVTDTLVPAANGIPGNALDQWIDLIGVQLRIKKKTYADVATVLLAATDGNTASITLWGTNTVQGPVAVTPPSTQKITFAIIANQVLGTAATSLSATASSGLAVSFASSTPAVCTVSGTALTLISAGTCTITASQAGNATYPVASPVSRSFTVASAPGIPATAASGTLALSTTTIAFGAQVNNSASSERSVTLSNSGNSNLTIASIGITGSNAADFVAQAGTCTNGKVLAVSASCTYSMVFQPTALGNKTASVSVSHNGTSGASVVFLTGTSQAVAASVMQQLITEAINASAQALATVQNFVSATYDSFSTLVAGVGVRQVAPATTLPAAPATNINLSNQKNWSDPATWGGSLPIAGAAVVIPAGSTVVLDTNTPSLGELTINGTLQFARQDVTLTATNITVASTGALLIGAPDNYFTNKATITLTGARPSFPANRNIANTRGITVNGGKLELYGASPSPVWTQLNDHAQAGATSLTLKQAVNWTAGSTIAVGPSDFYGVNPTETLTLASTASGYSLSTTSALSKFRWGKLQYMTDNGLSLTAGTYTQHVTPAPTQLDQRAAVANLSRNIVIQGADDSAWQTQGFGAHVMIMNLSSKVFVDGVEIRRAGQAGAMARYPFHWHMLSYAFNTGTYLGDATGQEIRNSAIWNSAQRCVVVHGTNGVKVTNNICQDIKGHAMFLEDAVERRNVFEGNLVLKVRRPANADLILQHEGEPFTGGSSGFWITNPNNTFRSNVAGDAVGNGFWNAFPTTGVGLSRNAVNPDLAGTQWAALQMNPRNIPHNAGGFDAVFDNNVAYSTGEPGVNSDIMLADGGPNATDTGTTGPEAYKPTFDGRPYDINGTRLPSTAPGSATVRATFSRMTIYKTNGGYGNRISAPDYPEWVMSDVAGIYARGAGDDGAFFRGLFIGRSLNDKIGGTNTYPVLADPQAFFATYHSTFSMRDNTFAHIGFEEDKTYAERTESGVFKSDDYYTNQMERGTILNANNRMIQAFAGARSYPANLLSVNPTITGRNDLMENFSLAGAIWDPYGYWGNKGFYWVYDTPFYTSGGGCDPSLFPTVSGKNSAGKYNGQSCSGEFYGLIYDGDTDIFDEPTWENNALWPVDVERQDCNPGAYSSSSWGTAARACRQVVGSGWNSWKLGQMRGSSVRQGGKFVMRFPNPTGPIISGTGPKWLPGIKQGTMVNAEGQIVAASIPKVVSLRIANLSRDSDSFVLGVSFDGNKTPVGVVGATPDSAKRHRWALPPNVNLALFEGNKARVLVAATNLAEVEADTTGTKMWQDRSNNLVWVKIKGGFPADPWYRIVNYTAPFGQDLYKNVGLYIKANDIPN